MSRRDGFNRRRRAWPTIVLNREFSHALSRVIRRDRIRRS